MTRSLAAAVLAVLLLAGCASAPPSAASSRFRSLVLVETSGGSPETETFVSRFLLVLSEAGLGNVADARLAGAKIGMLRDAASPEASRFRGRYPGDAYLGLTLDPCGYAGRGTGISCTVTLLLLSPDGKEAARFDTSGSNATLITGADDKSPEAEASRAAAEKAARKLLGLVTR
ncbi:MAG: hypothetical protein ACHQPI_06685 [Thermoanaerobaculia bacterium]